MNGDWSFLRENQYIFGLLSGLVLGVIANFATKAIEKWRDRRSAQRRDALAKRSARKQELFEYRVRLAQQDRTKLALLIHRGHYLAISGNVWQAAGVIVFLVGLFGFMMAWMYFGGSIKYQVLPGGLLVLLTVVALKLVRLGWRAHLDADDLLDAARSVIPPADKPLMEDDDYLDHIEFDVSNGTTRVSRSES